MKRWILPLLIVLASIAPTSLAQDEVIASGFTSPRGIAYDSAGNLYVTEAGNGGPLSAEGAFGPEEVGGSGALKMVTTAGRTRTLLQVIPSQGPANASRGMQSVMVTDESIWLLIGETPTSLPFSHALIELDPENFRIQTFVDLYTIEAQLNPDGDIISSNPTDFVMADGGIFYIANAGCNCIQRWSEGSDVEIFTSWNITDNPVPTTVALGPDGSLYVGFLSGFPFPTGGSRIERWSQNGELLETFSGLTAIVDLLITDDGTIYAVEHGIFTDTGFAPGRVIRITEGEPESVLDNLNRPWGLAMAPDGSIVVSVNSVSSDGAVVRVPGG